MRQALNFMAERSLFLMATIAIYSSTSLSAPIVAVSVEPLALLVKEICASECDTWTMVPKGSSEHSWQPGPKDLVKAKSVIAAIGIGLRFDERWFQKLGIQDSNVYLIGAQLDPKPWWSDDLTGEARHRGASSQDSSAKVSGSKHSHNHKHDDSHAEITDEHGDIDPHVWIDAERMAMAARKIGEFLTRYLPRSQFMARAEKIASRLLALQVEVENRRKLWRARPVVMLHDNAGYFARRFDLPILSVISGNGGHELSAKMLADVVKRFKLAGVAGILAEREDGITKNLARELAVQTVVVDFGAYKTYKNWDEWFLSIVQSWERVLK